VSAPASSWEDPRRALARHGLAPKRAFSQNFLVSRHAVERIVDALDVREGTAVVELGPGLGTLTRALLGAGATVRAIEADPAMRAVLEADLVAEGWPLTVLDGDAATFVPEAGERVVGNLPYAVTGAILRNLVGARDRIERAVVMVQKEVGQRLMAAPGGKTYGALTVFTQAAFAIERVVAVPAGAFHPKPKVDSAVLRLTPHATPRAVETPMFRRVVRAAFQARRKTLRNALGSLGLDKAKVTEALGEWAKARGETLGVEDFAALAARLEGEP
jgi:16S rRNA (adenine1518-N6/adenine1519-N6)-dimethyltransferase